jgi:hypothetical protein
MPVFPLGAAPPATQSEQKRLAVRQYNEDRSAIEIMPPNPPTFPFTHSIVQQQLHEGCPKTRHPGHNVTELRQADEPKDRGKSIAEVAHARQDE